MTTIQLSSNAHGNLSNNHMMNCATSALGIESSTTDEANMHTSGLANAVTMTLMDAPNTATITSPLNTSQPINSQSTLKESAQGAQSSPKKTHGQTGPKSSAGKKAIRFNALKTGRYAKSTLLPFEDSKAYAKHSKAVFNALAPENYIEAQLVDEYVNATWRILRHETRGAYEREKILERLTPQMAAQTIGITGDRASRAPEYLTQLHYVVSSKERTKAKTGLQQYAHLLQNAKGIQNFNLVWRQYPDLFNALSIWMKDRQISPTLLGATGQGLNIVWQQHPQKLLAYLEILADELYYQANWDLMRPQIRVWMESYYFLQRTEQHRINQDEQLLMKERNYAHGLLDRLMRQRKNSFLWSVSAGEEFL